MCLLAIFCESSILATKTMEKTIVYENIELIHPDRMEELRSDLQQRTGLKIVRVEIGDDQDSGVARSSRAGTKRSVKADPTSRFWPGRSGRVPRIQTFRKPFLSRTVVMVAVETRDRVAIASGVRDIEKKAPVTGFD